ncbi:hypothetical protein [Microbacterium sp. GXS0129]|uniref:hypothetical protein n=1 Tax=Microbacterium sp. GXS0129 TaxID=3377836 RepID=UPI00383B89CA
MSHVVARCPLCNQKSSVPDGAAFQCHNDTCAEDAERIRNPREVITREQMMRDCAVVYYVAFGNRIRIGTTTDLAGRMKALPYDEFVAFEFGGYHLARQRRAQFSGARITVTWLERSDQELKTWIRQLRAAMEYPNDATRSATRAVKRRLLGLEVR